jgi:hypothetical protein
MSGPMGGAKPGRKLKVRVWDVVVGCQEVANGRSEVRRCQGKLVVKVLALRENQEGGGAEVDVGWETGLYACDA